MAGASPCHAAMDRPTAQRLCRRQGVSSSLPRAEAGFSLVEVLAALALAAMMLVAAFDTFGTLALVADRQVRSTAARNLARVLLAEGVTGQDRLEGLGWQATVEQLSPHLVRRDLIISAPNGPILTLGQFDLVDPAQ